MRIQARHPHAGEIPLFCGFSAGVFPFSVSVERVPSEKVLAPFQLRQHDMSDEYTSARILARRRWRSFRATFSSTLLPVAHGGGAARRGAFCVVMKNQSYTMVGRTVQECYLRYYMLDGELAKALLRGGRAVSERERTALH